MTRTATSTWGIASPRLVRRAFMSVTALLAVGIVGGTLAPGASAATHGSRYADETSGGHVALVFSRDGRQVKRAFVAYSYKCSDPNENFTDFESLKSLSVSASRKFKASYDTGPQPSTVQPGVLVQFTGSIKGRRTASGRRVSGTFRFTVQTTVVATGAKLTCDTGKISYSAKD